MEAFNSYSFDTDDKYKDWVSRLEGEVPSGGDGLRRLRARYYKRFVDTTFDLPQPARPEPQPSPPPRPAPTQSQSQQTRPPPSSSSRSTPPPQRPLGGRLDLVQLGTYAMFVLVLPFYVLSILLAPTWTSWLYGQAWLLYAVAVGTRLYSTIGFQPSMAYLSLLSSNPLALDLFYTLIVWLCYPSFLFFLPAAVHTFLFILPRLDALVAQFPQLAPVARKVRETPQPELQLQANAYTFELFGLPAALFGGNLMMSFLYFRFLQARYRSTPLMRDVAVRLTYVIDTYMQKTPAFLRNIWLKIRPFLP